MPYPYLEVSGTPREMGRQHGVQAYERVHGFLEYLYRGARRPQNEVLQAAASFLPLFQQHCPVVLEEVHGLAEGAEVRFEEALLLQLRGEVLPHLPAAGCTTFAVAGGQTRDGGLLIGQNSDVDPAMQPFFQVVKLLPAHGPRLLMWTLAGQLGYHGLSEWGVAHFANSLAGGPVAGAAPGHPTGLSHYPIKRRLYEARSQAEVLNLWRSLPVCSSGNYMMAAGPALFDVEVTPAGIAVLEDPGCGFLAHANHFLSSEFRTPETDAAALRDSFARQQRMTELLAAQCGALTGAAMRTLLADHHGRPHGICRHGANEENGMTTAAGLIAEPREGKLHVSWGPPCQGDWTCYKL